jgi:hypothetical protein
MQAKAVIKERVQRNLLLLIDGQKSQEMLLANVAGIRQEDFDALHAMGLIEPAGASGRGRPAVGTASAATAPAATAAPAAAADEPAPLDYAHFTETLTRLVSKELGLRGFTLTLAIEKAGTIEDLVAVATRAIEQIRERKGADAADAARRALYGR